ncbi:hypothetical protein NX821_002263 [Clostridium septicum]|uniref:hypothetical protein n=1 Tax=Clostridium septicum TaxID=1504 RepID=UPI0032166A64
MRKRVNENKNKFVLKDNLVKKGQRIDWNASVGKIIKVLYYGNEYRFKIVDYHKGNNSISIQYDDKEPFKILTNNFLKVNIGKYVGKFTNDFKVEVGTIFRNNGRSIEIIIREYRRENKDGYLRNEKWYKYKCNNCPNIDWIIESQLQNGGGCNVCGATNPKPLLGYNTVFDKDQYTTKAIGEEIAKMHTCGSDKEVWPICPLCGMEKGKKMKIGSINYAQSIGCPYCSDGVSFPNKMIRQLTLQLYEKGQISKFEFEYSSEWLKGCSYDVILYINDEAFIVEMDGELGHGNKVHSKSNLTVEESKERDNRKDEASKGKIKEVIRIDCFYRNIKERFEFIKRNILNSDLAKLVDLSVIDWEKANEYSQCSLVKVACDYKNKNPLMTTGDIAKEMNMSLSAIYSYLKIGSELGWYDYDANYERKLTNAKVAQLSKNRDSTPVLIYIKNTMELVGEEESQAKLAEVSEVKYGTKLVKSTISRAVNGKIDSYKGFVIVFKNKDDIKNNIKLRRIIHDVCNYKKRNPNKTTTEIAIEFALSRTTIIDYLKQGSKVGICSYNPKEETIKRINRWKNTTKDNCEKQVSLFKDGKYIDTFISQTQLVKDSMEMLGVKLNKASISRVVNGYQKEHKGYTIVALDKI